MDWKTTTASWDKKHLSFEIWCDLYERFCGRWYWYNNIESIMNIDENFVVTLMRSVQQDMSFRAPIQYKDVVLPVN